MDTTEVGEIATAWMRCYRRKEWSPEREEFFWAWERLNDMVSKSPEDAWTIIETIRQSNPSEWVLSNLAAGPLEDLLAKHGPAFIDRIETLARQDPTFRHLLGGVWQNAIRDDIWTKVMAAAGPRW